MCNLLRLIITIAVRLLVWTALDISGLPHVFANLLLDIGGGFGVDFFELRLYEEFPGWWEVDTTWLIKGRDILAEEEGEGRSSDFTRPYLLDWSLVQDLLSEEDGISLELSAEALQAQGLHVTRIIFNLRTHWVSNGE